MVSNFLKSIIAKTKFELPIIEENKQAFHHTKFQNTLVISSNLTNPSSMLYGAAADMGQVTRVVPL